MNENLRLVLAVAILIAVYLFTRRVMVWWMSRAAEHIVKDLQKQEAFDEASAVRLPYAEKSWARFGLRDYEGKALQGLIAAGVVAQTEDGRYFFKGVYSVP